MTRTTMMTTETVRTIGLALLGVTLALAAGSARGDYTYRSQFGTIGTGNGQLNAPDGVALDGSGNVVVADLVNNRIEEFSPAAAVPEPSSLVLAGLGVALAAGWARCCHHG